MKHKATLLLASLALVFSSGLISRQKNVSSVEAASHPANYDNYIYSGSYYSSLGSNLTEGMSGTLRTNLTSLIHPTSVPAYSGTGSTNQLSYVLQYADEDPLNSSNMIYLYTRDSVTKNAASSWNREHVWPQSLSNSCWKTSRAGADMLHLRPTYETTNSKRGNDKYGEFSGGTTCIYNNNITYGYSSGGYFKPLDSVKGDVARICMYVWVAYYNEYGSNLPPLTNVFESFDTLMSWHTSDHPDVMEGNRNNYCENSFQGNRNPFVDHPEYAWKIFGSQCSQSVLNAAKAAYPEGNQTGITSISKTSATIAVGDTTTISAVSSNSGTISWSSSNTSIATVSNATAASGSNVTITAVAQGSATITASITISGTTYTKTCSVTVTAAKTLSSIAVSNAKTSYVVDDTFIKPTVTATFSDSSTDDVKDSAVFSGYDLSQAGNQTVSVSYTYKGVQRTTSYQITVSESGGSGESGDFSETYNVSNQGTGTGKTWTLSDYSNETSYLKCPNNGTESIAHIPGIFTDKTITSSVIITIHSATFGSGSNPTSSTFSIYNSSACTSQVTASQTGTLPSNSTYKDVIYTVSQANASSFNDDLAIKIVKPGKQIRLQTISVEFSYETSSGSSVPILSTISISTAPTKTTYSVGEYFDPTGLVITRTYSDSSSDTYTYAGHTSDFTFVPSTITPLTSEDDSIEVIYGGESCFFEIELTAAKELSSISISGYTIAFVEGDTFAFGGTVTAHYTDASTENVTSSATFSGYDMTSVGNQTVTVTYQGESAMYEIAVSAGTLNSIAVSGQTTEYQKNYSFSFDGTCTATFANGYQKIVTPTSVSSPDMTTAGQKSVTVSFTYNNVTKTTSYSITVNSNRVVIESSAISSTITWSSSTATVTGDVSATVTNVQYTYYESNSLRLGTGSGGGQIRIDSEENINSVVVTAKAYSDSRKGNLSVGDQTLNVTNTGYVEFEEVILGTPTNSLVLSTPSSSVRINIQSIVINCVGEVDISSSQDCIGLESFIDTYMHMDYVENLGYCSDSEHHYYSTAKAAFNALNTHQRSLFTGNSAYSVEWTRLSTWASKNGDSLNGSNQLASGVSQNPVAIVIGSSGNVVAIIVAVSLITAASIGGYFFLRKRKEF